MDMPKTIRVGNRRYTIKLQHVDEPYTTGYTVDNLIVIASSNKTKHTTENERALTFWHELTHVILDHVRPILAKHDLAIYQSLYAVEGRVGVSTFVVGPEGDQAISSISIATNPQSTPQTIGSAITYLRRQSIQAGLGISTDADDDGAVASTPTTKKWEPKTNG